MREVVLEGGADGPSGYTLKAVFGVGEPLERGGRRGGEAMLRLRSSPEWPGCRVRPSLISGAILSPSDHPIDFDDSLSFHAL